MKVMIILPSLLIGGGQRVAIDIAGDESNFIFVIIGERVNSSFTEEVEKSHQVYYLDKQLGFNPKIFHKIGKILDIEKPEIVHFHLGVSLYGLVPCLFRTKIKLVYTFHTIAEKDSEGIIRKLCYIGIKCRGMIPIAITETVKSSIESIYNIHNVEIIYNGIDTSKYYCDIDKEKKDEKIKLVAVGQIWQAKNQFFLVDVMEQIRNLDSRDKYSLYILGDGPLKKELEEYIKRKGLSEQIKLMGNVDNVSEYLAKMDVFVLSSNYEGLSLATLEAMASSLPIVSLDVGGMKDIVKDNGVLIQRGNIIEFAEAVMQLGENDYLRKNMGELSAEYVKRYDRKEMRKSYYRLYDSIVNKK